MKILIVRTFPSILDPHQYNVQEIGLAKALTRKGYQCGIVLYNGNSKNVIEKVAVDCDGEKNEIIIYKLRGFSILKNGFFWSLNNIVKQYDIIQVHEYDQISSWFYYTFKRKKTVIYHGPYFHEFNRAYNFKCNIFDHTFLKLTRHKKDINCLTKSSLAADFLRTKGFEKIKAVGVGLDIDNFKDLQAGKFIIDDNWKNIIYVGKIEERRNSLFLIKLFKQICTLKDNVKFIVVGNGEKEYLERFKIEAMDLLKDGCLQYYESATQEELGYLYSRADLMIFPSIYEIFGMVLLEAAYFQLPVLCSENGGADLFRHQKRWGTVISGFDVNQWSEAVSNLLSMKRKKIHDTRDDVTWDYLVQEFIRSYNDVLNK